MGVGLVKPIMEDADRVVITHHMPPTCCSRSAPTSASAAGDDASARISVAARKVYAAAPASAAASCVMRVLWTSRRRGRRRRRRRRRSRSTSITTPATSSEISPISGRGQALLPARRGASTHHRLHYWLCCWLQGVTMRGLVKHVLHITCDACTCACTCTCRCGCMWNVRIFACYHSSKGSGSADTQHHTVRNTCTSISASACCREAAVATTAVDVDIASACSSLACDMHRHRGQ